MVVGTVMVIKPHGHERENNNYMLISNFRNILKHRASTENIMLKLLYDEEVRRVTILTIF